MSKLQRRNKSAIEEVVSQVKDVIENEPLEPIEQKPILWDSVPIVSTNCTLLDLTISGGRLYEGGIPACILGEWHGPAGSGKTAILSEIGANVQKQGGDIQYQDPEARFDKEYARIYDIELDKRNYHRPSTVTEVFELIKKWKTDNILKALLTDSLAALTTDFELEKGDKMGMRRAKEFSEGLRKNARTIGNMLWMASNQERDGEHGPTTPGGNAVGFYASLRVRIRQIEKLDLEKEYKPTNIPDWILGAKKEKEGEKEEDVFETDKKKRKKKEEVVLKKFIGIKSECFVTKSTIDDPYRSCPIYIIFGHGIDDVRGNLQYIKDMYGLSTYATPDGKRWMGLEQAITHVYESGRINDLREQVIITWHEAEELFRANRERKKIR